MREREFEKAVRIYRAADLDVSKYAGVFEPSLHPFLYVFHRPNMAAHNAAYRRAENVIGQELALDAVHDAIVGALARLPF